MLEKVEDLGERGAGEGWGGKGRGSVKKRRIKIITDSLNLV